MESCMRVLPSPSLLALLTRFSFFRHRALTAAAPTHPLVLDLAEKGRAFDDAASKFQVAQAA